MVLTRFINMTTCYFIISLTHRTCFHFHIGFMVFMVYLPGQLHSTFSEHLSRIQLCSLTISTSSLVMVNLGLNYFVSFGGFADFGAHVLYAVFGSFYISFSFIL